MDGQYDHNEFEHFLKQNADAHRLYPSDKVWERIYSRMHGRHRKVAALLLLLLPLLAASGWLLLNPMEEKISSALTKTPLLRSAETSPNSDAKKILNSKPASATTVSLMASTPVNRFPAISTNSQPVAIAVDNSPENTTELPAKTFTEAPAEIAASAPVSATLVSAIANQLANEIPSKEEERYPLDIESVVNSYQRQVHRPRFRWQLHFTPTVSYRSLQEDQKFIAQARISSAAPASANTNPTDLSSVIRHRPDLGMQVGFTGTYPISKKIDWVTGIQFNVSKYDIEAYNYPSEVATIALLNPWGGTSTVSTLTSFRSNGFRSSANWLRNYYYSISIPMGLQWRILGKKNTHWGISATAQPTYVVGNRSYVISVDYQNYAEVPYLINKWNLNVGLETYARFQLGKNDFQVGPQIRYQALSSFKKGYPVQEHLYDFGIKLGMTLGK
ncbi:MAG: outer membrane beta-barrel protein [Sphingomonadales bacterium]